jgi:hypothetical protein
VTARAFVTRFGNERTSADNFFVDAYFVVIDPTTFPAQTGKVCVVTVTLNPLDTLVQWQTAIKNAVIATAAALSSPFIVAVADVATPILG